MGSSVPICPQDSPVTRLISPTTAALDAPAGLSILRIPLGVIPFSSVFRKAGRRKKICAPPRPTLLVFDMLADGVYEFIHHLFQFAADHTAAGEHVPAAAVNGRDLVYVRSSLGT